MISKTFDIMSHFILLQVNKGVQRGWCNLLVFWIHSWQLQPWFYRTEHWWQNIQFTISLLTVWKLSLKSLLESLVLRSVQFSSFLNYNYNKQSILRNICKNGFPRSLYYLLNSKFVYAKLLTENIRYWHMKHLYGCMQTSTREIFIILDPQLLTSTDAWGPAGILD